MVGMVELQVRRGARGGAVGALVVALFTALLLSGLPVPAAQAAQAGPEHRVIVRATPGDLAAAEALVEAAGGTVAVRLGLIEGLAASVPAAAVDALAAHPVVEAVTDDYAVESLQAEAATAEGTVLGAMPALAAMIGADRLWDQGITGEGVDVALIDTGVLPVDGLTAPGKVVHAPDLSLDSQEAGLRHLDAYGHGTAMAGIIAGRDDAITDPAADRGAGFQGIAPGAGILNVKVGAANGAVDVSQVIAAIDWVVQHGDDEGRNVRVINLSFGTDSVQPAEVDPLSYAAEVAWRKGIVVVAATGNDGRGTQLAMPAANPHILAVGASDHMGTAGTSDDRPATFSTYANGRRRPDLLAPGVGVVSLRAPGSHLDSTYPQAIRGERFFRGSGTSQAAAVTSGAVALLLEQRPELTPDQVKALLQGSAAPLKATSNNAQGAGLLDVAKAADAATPKKVQKVTAGTGTGSLDASRGSHRVEIDGVQLEGELDVLGNPWDGASWSGASWSGASWSGASWSGASWSGASWSGASWSGASWSGASWSGASWSGASWSGASWSGASWSGASWSGASWSGASWSGASWSGASWS